ncbi:MAG: BMP family ABC transporter substrate-binding protein [Chloroflexi bacterium]|nr:MAG: BMP family ABC transporter substrate-binding protein [Chloroflexota bacterium]
MKKSSHLALAMLAAVGVGACGGGGPTATSSSSTIKAAWIYVGPTADHGWTQAHDEGRKYVEQQLGSTVQTTFKENVLEGPQVATVVEDLIRDGNKIGTKTATNMGEYFGAAEDADYLTGMALGAASKKGKIGFVAPFPIPEVIREINAIALGAQTTHPGATVQVVWTNTWFDPTKEKQAAESLLARGVDAIGQGQDSPATGDAAKAKGIPWSGYDSDQSSYAPDVWLTGTVYHWGPYYARQVKAARDGTWKSDNYYGSIADGMIGLAPFGKSVPASVQTQINNKMDALKNGSFYEFAGPLKDQSGAVHVPAGKKLTVDELYGMDWFVQGVIGSPKGG